jgi:hypothetical protein
MQQPLTRARRAHYSPQLLGGAQAGASRARAPPRWIYMVSKVVPPGEPSHPQHICTPLPHQARIGSDSALRDLLSDGFAAAASADARQAEAVATTNKKVRQGGAIDATLQYSRGPHSRCRAQVNRARLSLIPPPIAPHCPPRPSQSSWSCCYRRTARCLGALSSWPLSSRDSSRCARRPLPGPRNAAALVRVRFCSRPRCCKQSSLKPHMAVGSLGLLH